MAMEQSLNTLLAQLLHLRRSPYRTAYNPITIGSSTKSICGLIEVKLYAHPSISSHVDTVDVDNPFTFKVQLRIKLRPARNVKSTVWYTELFSAFRNTQLAIEQGKTLLTFTQ